jgi:hypothetical protein
MRRIAAFALALAALAAPGCSQEPGTQSASASAGRQCFRPGLASSFTAEGDRTVFVTVGARQVYRLEIVGICPDIDWSQRIAIRNRGGSGWVCGGMDAELLVRGPTGIDRCPVTNVTRLSEAEAAAWRERRRRD